MKPLFAILFTTVSLFGCSTPQPLPLTEIETLTFGEPIIQGPLLHIPVITNDGRGYREHSAKKICRVSTQAYQQTIAFRLSECSLVGGLNRTPTIALPILTIHHADPTTYNMVYVDPDDKLIPLGQMIIDDSTTRYPQTTIPLGAPHHDPTPPHQSRPTIDRMRQPTP